MGIPFNELNRAFELGFKPLPWGDQGHIPSAMQPADGLSPKADGRNPKEGRRPKGGRLEVCSPIMGERMFLRGWGGLEYGWQTRATDTLLPRRIRRRSTRTCRRTRGRHATCRKLPNRLRGRAGCWQRWA